MAIPAVTEPPGELMYNQMSAWGSSASRKSSWAQISVGDVIVDFGAQHDHPALQEAVEYLATSVSGTTISSESRGANAMSMARQAIRVGHECARTNQERFMNGCPGTGDLTPDTADPRTAARRGGGLSADTAAAQLMARLHRRTGRSMGCSDRRCQPVGGRSRINYQPWRSTHACGPNIRLPPHRRVGARLPARRRAPRSPCDPRRSWCGPGPTRWHAGLQIPTPPLPCRHFVALLRSRRASRRFRRRGFPSAALTGSCSHGHMSSPHCAAAARTVSPDPRFQARASGAQPSV